MNLQEQLNRIQEMMGVNESNNPSNNIRRRLPQIKKLLQISLNNSYPCDFEDFKHYMEGILYDVNTFLVVFDMEGLTPDEIIDFIKDYMIGEIEQYYINSLEDC
jgi:hypothetical protein